MADLATYLIAVNAGKHQIQKNQIRVEGLKFFQSQFTVIYNLCFETFFGKIQRNQLCNIIVVIDNEDFLFGTHSFSFYFLNSTIVTPASPSPNSARWKSATCFWRRR